MVRHRTITLPAALALALAACSLIPSAGQSSGTGADGGTAGGGGSATTPTGSVQATGCVASYPDAGTSDDQCAVQWACNAGTQTYEIACQLAGSDYSCQCSTSTSSTRPTIMLDPFSCDLNGGALIAAGACGYMLEM